MQSTKNDLEMRKAEVEEVLKFLQYFETDFSIPSDADFSVLGVKTSIKANIVLMLYNAVESTVTSCLKKIHERIRNDSLKYRDLSDQLKKIMAVYYGHSMEKASNMDDEMVIALRFADCQTAHYGRCEPHFDFGRNTSLIVPHRYLTQIISGITADCRSLV